MKFSSVLLTKGLLVSEKKNPVSVRKFYELLNETLKNKTYFIMYICISKTGLGSRNYHSNSPLPFFFNLR